MEYLKKSVINKNKTDFINLYDKKVLKIGSYERSVIMKKINMIRLRHNLYNKLVNNKDINESYLCSFMDNNIKIDNVLLMLIKINNINNCYLINYNNIKDIKIYKVILKINNSLFINDSIFSGIITYNNRFHTLYLDNIIVLNGDLKFKMKLSNKLLTLHSILKDYYEYDSFQNPFYITIRSFWPLNHLDYVNKTGKIFFYPDDSYNRIYVHDYKVGEKNKIISNFNYKRNSQYFKNIHEILYFSIVDNKTNKINKYEDKEIEYKVIKDDKLSDIYKLYKDEEFIDILDVYSIDNSQKLNDKFKDSTELKLKCEYNKDRKSWICKL